MNPVEFWWTFLWACGVWRDAWDIITTALRIKIWTFVREIVCKVIAAGMLQLWLRIIFGFWDVSGRTPLMLGKIPAWKVLLKPNLWFWICRQALSRHLFSWEERCSSLFIPIHYHLSSVYICIYIYLCPYIFFPPGELTYPLPAKTLWKDDFPVAPFIAICYLPWTANIPSYSNFEMKHGSLWHLSIRASFLRDDALEWKNPLASRFFKVLSAGR